ncbi:superoxide dismutase [Klebsiella pneumoniae subsp. rhinoscleromatis]|nr:superoxide dismutase [Klebsiella pneumoniae subsp. rhinoscleromatis]
MRILCLDIPAPGATLEHYAPHLTAEAPATPGDCTSQALFATSISVRIDPGVAIFLECDTVEEANNVMAEFSLAKAGLLTVTNGAKLIHPSG